MAYEHQYHHSVLPKSSKYDTLLFDVDDTLYSSTTGFSKQCSKNILEFMVEKLGIAESEISQLNQILYNHYGTSMAGLKAIGYDFDDDEYHSFVHGRLPYENLKPDPVLRNLLLSLPMRKIIFSNADKIHVAKVLRKLELEDCFERIICFETLNPIHEKFNCNYAKNDNEIKLLRDELMVENSSHELPKTPMICKPFEDAFEKAFDYANINPKTTIFFDDSVRNIQTGKRMGLTTVLVGSSYRNSGADYVFESIHNIKEAIPQLLEANEEKKETIYYNAENVSIETSVLA
ncbi:Haloacid dehalogenase-like hydrolase (HAD) superfamily protein [Euphorbia peplus]|nr:Haloacid dehalogenase-like hydrolase (HAD) superfamily protein [Euphorbia peplus]